MLGEFPGVLSEVPGKKDLSQVVEILQRFLQVSHISTRGFGENFLYNFVYGLAPLFGNWTILWRSTCLATFCGLSTRK